MDYKLIHKGMRVRPAELFGELDQIEALHLNPGTVIEEPMSEEFTYFDGEEYRNLIRVKHDDGRIMHHTADQLDEEI